MHHFAITKLMEQLDAAADRHGLIVEVEVLAVAALIDIPLPGSRVAFKPGVVAYTMLVVERRPGPIGALMARKVKTPEFGEDAVEPMLRRLVAAYEHGDGLSAFAPACPRLLHQILACLNLSAVLERPWKGYEPWGG